MDLPASHFYFSHLEVFQAAPNEADKLRHARENAVQLIESIGQHLGFPIGTKSTAMLLFQRFYAIYDLHLHNPRDVTLACVFVACKIQETFKKMRDLLLATYAIEKPHVTVRPDAPVNIYRLVDGGYRK
jgi:CTD kinase subunit beta